MLRFIPPSAPNRLEGFLWRIPRYGKKRRLRYLIKYFRTSDKILINTGVYNPVTFDTVMKKLLRRKLNLGAFSEIDDIIADWFQYKLNLRLADKASEFLCSKPSLNDFRI